MKIQPNSSDWESKPDFWNECYAKQQTGWDRGSVHPALEHWLRTSQLRPCRIAVPGCGNGYEVVDLAQHGFDVTGIDFAAEPVKRLRSKIEGLEGLELRSQIIQEDVLKFAPAEKFAAIYEQTCLCAIEPDQRVAYERRLFDWLDKNGTLYILFMQTDNDSGQPPFHCDIEDMKTLFHEDRWQWSQAPFVRYDHPSGKIFEYAAQLRRKEPKHVG